MCIYYKNVINHHLGAETFRPLSSLSLLLIALSRLPCTSFHLRIIRQRLRVSLYSFFDVTFDVPGMSVPMCAVRLHLIRHSTMHPIHKHRQQFNFIIQSFYICHQPMTRFVFHFNILDYFRIHCLCLP